MFLTKKKKLMIEQEFSSLRNRICDLEAQLVLLCDKQELAITPNWNPPRFVIKDKKESKSIGLCGQSTLNKPFKL